MASALGSFQNRVVLPDLPGGQGRLGGPEQKLSNIMARNCTNSSPGRVTGRVSRGAGPQPAREGVAGAPPRLHWQPLCTSGSLC